MGAADTLGAQHAPTPLTVYAAADLAEALEEVVPQFEIVSGARVRVVLGSSGNLALQIEHGAPADVFFAANTAFVERLQAKDLVVADSRRAYARGRIVLATAAGAAPLSLRDLTQSRVTKIAIANPAYAPYGEAAREALIASGLWAAVRSKLVYAENVRQSLQLVQSGAVDAAFVALSSVQGRTNEKPTSPRFVPIDDSLYMPLDQVAAVVTASHQQAMARRFLAFVTGPIGRATMARRGFAAPR